MRAMIFIVTTLATAFYLWRFRRTQLARRWDEGTLAQHRLFICSVNISIVLFFCTVIYVFYYIWGDWLSYPPLWTDFVGFVFIQHIVIAALATENRGKRLKRINEHYRFKALLRRPPSAPAPEPTAEEKIRDLIQKNKR